MQVAFSAPSPDGRVLGTLTPRLPGPHISDEEMRLLEDPTTGTWYTAEQIEAKLRELRAAP